MSFRTLSLAATLASYAWFALLQSASAPAISQRALDVLDPRPSRSVLIIGNSLTLANNMPAMLREIADSAGSPTKFEIETSCYGAATFRIHWEKSRTRNFLEDHWDDVILQPESGAQATRQGNDEFLEYGAKLGASANASNDRTYLVVDWAYDPQLYLDPDYIAQGYGFGRADHLHLIRSMTAKLASEQKLRRINVADAWEAVRSTAPPIPLTTDGSHPSIAGTYLYALATYARLSNGPVGGVTYVPHGLSAEAGKRLREAVDSTLQLP